MPRARQRGKPTACAGEFTAMQMPQSHRSNYHPERQYWRNSSCCCVVSTP